MKARKAYEQKLHAQLREWSAEIDKLEAKADRAEAEVQIEYNKRIEELRVMQKNANQKLAEFKAAGAESWEDLKRGMDSAWDSLSTALQSAVSRFR